MNINKYQQISTNIKPQQKGITLIEVTVASIILTIVAFSFVSLLALGIDSFYFSKEKSQALALAQEGLEVTRSVRDTISTSATTGSGATGQIGSGWVSGFALKSPQNNTTGTNYCVPSSPGNILKDWSTCSGPDICSDPSTCLNTDKHRTNLEVNLPFTLEINISSAASLSQADRVDNGKIIKATVTWQHRGRDKTVTLQTMLTRWKALE